MLMLQEGCVQNSSENIFDLPFLPWLSRRSSVPQNKYGALHILVLKTIIIEFENKIIYIVPGNGHDDLHHLVVRFKDDLLNGCQTESRKFSIMSLLSIMANNRQRPGIFSKYRLTGIF